MRVPRRKLHLSLLLSALGFVLLVGCAPNVSGGRDAAEVCGAELESILDPRLFWTRARIEHDSREMNTHIVGLISSRAVPFADGSCLLGSEASEEAQKALHTPTPDVWPAGDAVHSETETFASDLVAREAAVAREFEFAASGIDRGTRSVLVVHQDRLVRERHAPGWVRHAPQNGRPVSKVMASILASKVAHDGMFQLDSASLHSDWTDDRSQVFPAASSQQQGPRGSPRPSTGVAQLSPLISF